jgi:hypothetical protein
MTLSNTLPQTNDYSTIYCTHLKSHPLSKFDKKKSPKVGAIAPYPEIQKSAPTQDSFNPKINTHVQLRYLLFLN